MARKNFATSLITTAPSPATTGTSLDVTSGHGSRFSSDDLPIHATVHPANQVPTLDNSEIVQITAISTDTFTIVRGEKESSAKSIAAGWRISEAIYSENFEVKINGDGINKATSSTTAPTDPDDGDIWLDPDENDTTIEDLVDDAVATKNLVDYPIGTLYMNRTSSANPNTFMTGMSGTTWVRLEDVMIMARGDDYTADGGSATHDHELSDNGWAQVYNGNSGTIIRENTGESWGTGDNTISAGSKSTNTTSYTRGADLDGATDEGDNIPPMIVAYVWERTA